MPRPVYIICVENVVEDKAGTIALMRVVEKIDVSRHDVAKVGIPTEKKKRNFQLVAVWMRTDGESSGPYEFEFTMRVGEYLMETDAGGESPRGTFSFVSPLHRIIANGEIDSFPSPGILEMECRVRIAGTEGNWITQSYPVFLLDKTPTPSSAAPQPPS
jgi:hypothetical protein